MNSLLYHALLALPCFFPALWRLLDHGVGQPAGLLSDLTLGLCLFLLIRVSPRWLRALVLAVWVLIQLVSQELLATMQRLPSWQDVGFLLDPSFVANSAAGLHLAAPGFAAGIVAAAIPAVVVRTRPFSKRLVAAGLAACVAMFVLQAAMAKTLGSQSVASRYNPLHWAVLDAWSGPAAAAVLEAGDLPESLRRLDLDGRRLLPPARARNVLIVTLEGISGIYLPEIRQSMQVPEGVFQMNNLAEATAEAMLTADFVTHSHQTIRGLYALHCGDFSKFSYETSKAFELLSNPERAAQCLPAQLAAHGWQTHYLQGANLRFMNKDRVMPVMGFQQVHGLEWFEEANRDQFIWGTSDADFFHGAKTYITELRAGKKPWLLSLLTVATHQPYAAPDDLAERYGSRKIASVALLDQAVSEFIGWLRREGVLDDTLVIITSDESHGAKGADWYGSWGFAMVLTPEQAELPRLKTGTYGLVDIEASVLDYFGLPMPADIIGRSLFRDYESSREMVSYTSSKLRWQTADGLLYECGRDNTCLVARAPSLVDRSTAVFTADAQQSASRLFGLAEVLDHKLTGDGPERVMDFAGGEIRRLPETIRNEWTDNLIGAQYLDFPENSRVRVDIRLQAVSAPPSGIQLKLTLRQFEKEVTTIDYPAFPLLQAGEQSQLSFEFDNPKARQSFSFHLVGEGADASIRLDRFTVTITRNNNKVSSAGR